MISIPLGQQAEITKMPCFLCEWDSRARASHWVDIEWLVLIELRPGCKNVILPSLVDRSDVLLQPLHIKLGLMSQFVKALDNEGACFKYILEVFDVMTPEKIKADIFDGPTKLE